MRPAPPMFQPIGRALRAMGWNTGEAMRRAIFVQSRPVKREQSMYSEGTQWSSGSRAPPKLV